MRESHSRSRSRRRRRPAESSSSESDGGGNDGVSSAVQRADAALQLQPVIGAVQRSAAAPPQPVIDAPQLQSVVAAAAQPVSAAPQQSVVAAAVQPIIDAQLLVSAAVQPVIAAPHQPVVAAAVQPVFDAPQQAVVAAYGPISASAMVRNVALDVHDCQRAVVDAQSIWAQYLDFEAQNIDDVQRAVDGGTPLQEALDDLKAQHLQEHALLQAPQQQAFQQQAFDMDAFNSIGTDCEVNRDALSDLRRKQADPDNEEKKLKIRIGRLEQERQNAIYRDKKLNFERNHVKIEDPPSFAVSTATGILQLLPQTFSQRMQHFGGFITRWLTDPDIRILRKAVYVPNRETASDELQLFDGFDASKGPALPLTSPSKMKLIFDHIKRMHENDEELTEQHFNFLHHMLTVGERAGVSPMYYSIVKGVGKSTYFRRFVGGMIGDRHVFHTERQSDVMASFNSQLEKKVLVIIDELETRKFHQGMKTLNGHITNETLKLTRKGGELYQVHNCLHVVIIGNIDKEFVLDLKANDRRYIPHKVAFERSDFPEDGLVELVALLNDPAYQQAMYRFIIGRDNEYRLTDQHSRKATQLHRDIAQANEDPLVMWLRSCVAQGGDALFVSCKLCNIGEWFQAFCNRNHMSSAGAADTRNLMTRFRKMKPGITYNTERRTWSISNVQQLSAYLASV